MKIHIVQKGDTLWKIAKKYGVNFEELKKMNSQLSNPDMIMPGMKIKVPTTGGTIKKEGPIKAEQPFAKEVPIKEVPIKEVPIKEVPIKEVPIKEQPIIKEAPKAPYTPKMPLQVVPEIDINNYYMTNMTNMTVKPELPPKPANILPEVKEVPKKEMPIPAPLPVPECPPVQDYCVPVTPVMPGPGFCPPFGGIPMQMPCPPVQAPAQMMPVSNAVPNMLPNMTPNNPGPMMGGAYMPHYHDESSAFMPQMPMNPGYNPGYNPGGPVMEGTYPQGAAPGFQQPMGMEPGAYGMQQAYQPMPGAYGGMPMGYGQTPAGYGEMPGGHPGGYPGGYGEMPGGYPGGYGEMPGGYPGGYGEMPGGYPGGHMQTPGAGGFPAGMEFTPGAPAAPGIPDGAYGPGAGAPYSGGYQPYGPTPYGYPQMMGTTPYTRGPEFDYESPERASQAIGAPIPLMQEASVQGLPTGAGGDCGCGPGQPAGMPVDFVPPTPPIYSAPYTGPNDVAQPPFMNPYGIGPMGTSSYGMPGYHDESS
nr:SafA/ExsA family spore coat assembly protein [Neobacillus mesonae]